MKRPALSCGLLRRLELDLANPYHANGWLTRPMVDRIPSMRILILFLTLVLAACGRIERERQAAADSARIATTAELGRVLSETGRRVDRLARSADRILSPMPVMTPLEENRLRRFQNAAHVARARALGERVTDETVLDTLLAQGRLVELEDSTRYWIVRRGTSHAQVTPDLRILLEILGDRFQTRLADLDLPPWRFEVTSALRTAERQEELRGANANAAAGVSSHEFGTTVDLSYAAFAPPADRPGELLADLPADVRPHVERLIDLSFESVSARKSRELGAIFSQVLTEAQDEGLALVIYERQQTVYHVTVARGLGPQGD